MTEYSTNYFLANDIFLAGPNTDWSLVGTWKG